MSDTSHSLMIWIIIGTLSGCFAGIIWRGKPYRVTIDIMLGIVGACVVSGIAHALGLVIANSVFLDVVTSTAGALILLVAIRQVRRN